MGVMKWYKRDPDAALSGMMMLTLEERGAYNTVLDLIYSRQDNLPDDERFLAGWLRCDIRVWKRIRRRLIDMGKITIIDGRITNVRATSEVLAGISRVESAREAGRASGRKSAGEFSNNNTLGRTSVEPTLQLTTTTKNKREGDKSPSIPPAPRPKGEPFRFDSLPPEWMSWAMEDRGWGEDVIADVWTQFRDYWQSRGGKAGKKSDWGAAWRNWCRKENIKPKENRHDQPRSAGRPGQRHANFREQDYTAGTEGFVLIS